MPQARHNKSQDCNNAQDKSSLHGITHDEQGQRQTRLDKLLASVKPDDSLLVHFGNLSKTRKEMSIQHREASSDLKNALEGMKGRADGRNARLGVQIGVTEDHQQQATRDILQNFGHLQTQHLACYQAAQFALVTEQLDSVRAVHSQQKQGLLQDAVSLGSSGTELGHERLREREELIKRIEADRSTMQTLRHQVEEENSYFRAAMESASVRDLNFREEAMKEILSQQAAKTEALITKLKTTYAHLNEINLDKAIKIHMDILSLKLQERDRNKSIQSMEEQFQHLSDKGVINKTLGSFEPLRKLWEEAVHSIKTELRKDNAQDLYNVARAKFVELLTHPKRADSMAARGVFENAGYKFRLDKNDLIKKAMPVVNDPLLLKHLGYWDTSISLQHLDMLGDKKESERHPDNWRNALNADRLMMMSLRDNIHMDIERDRKTREDSIIALARSEASRLAAQDKVREDS